MHLGLFFLFAVLAGGLAFAAPFFQNLPLHMVASGSVLAYGLILLRDVRKAQAKGTGGSPHASHPESAYIVGYIATIGGFAGLAVFLGKSPNLNFKAVLPMILERGGFAVLSTLVGLVMLNVLKMSTEAPSPTPQEHDPALEQFAKLIGDQLGGALSGVNELPQEIGKQITRAFVDAKQIGELTENIGALRKEAVDSVTALGDLKQTSEDMQTIMRSARQQVPKLLEGLEKFNELSNKVVPAWEKLGSQAEEAARLNSALAASAVAFEKLHIATSASTQSISGFAEALPALQAQLTTTVEKLAPSVTAIEKFSQQLNGLLETPAEQLPRLTERLAAFQEKTVNLLPAMQQLVAMAAEVERLNLALAGAAVSLGRVQSASANSADSLDHFGQRLPELETNFGNLLAQVGDKLETLTQFSGALGTFLEYAKNAAPVLIATHEGFEEIGQIRERLQLVSGELLRLNETITSFREGTVLSSETSQTFSNNITNLSVNVSTAVNAIARLTGPIEQIGNMAKQAASASQWFDENGTGVERLKNNLTDLLGVIEGLKEVAGRTKDTVNNSAKSLKEFQELLPRLATKVVEPYVRR